MKIIKRSIEFYIKDERINFSMIVDKTFLCMNNDDKNIIEYTLKDFFEKEEPYGFLLKVEDTNTKATRWIDGANHILLCVFDTTGKPKKEEDKTISENAEWYKKLIEEQARKVRDQINKPSPSWPNPQYPIPQQPWKQYPDRHMWEDPYRITCSDSPDGQEYRLTNTAQAYPSKYDRVDSYQGFNLEQL